MAAINDDLPAFGNPTRPTSAIVFSSSTRRRSTPGSPRSAKPGAFRLAEASAAFPSPPRPPWAAMNLVPGPAERPPVKVEQRRGIGVDLDDHVAAPAAVASVRAAERLELLPADRGTAVPAVARVNAKLGPVSEFSHFPTPSRHAAHAPKSPGMRVCRTAHQCRERSTHDTATAWFRDRGS